MGPDGDLFLGKSCSGERLGVMNAHKPTSWTCWPAAGLLLTACGFAGCTGGPRVSSAPHTVPNAVSGRTVNVETAVLTQSDAYPDNSIWAGIETRKRAPIDPFVAPSANLTRSIESRQVDRSATPLLSVSHAEQGLPAITPNSTTTSAPGVVRVQDGRLPPAAPLGVSNPFNKTSDSTQQTPVPGLPQRTSVAPSVNPLPVRLVKSSRIDGGSLPKINPVPEEIGVPERAAIRGLNQGPVQNEDMIVESTLLRKRNEWRSEVIPPRAGDEEVPFPIAPRRPFSAPDWEHDAPATATANLPSEISPSSSNPGPGNDFAVAAIESVDTSTSEFADVTAPAFLSSEAEVAAAERSESEVEEDAPFVTPSTQEGPTLSVAESEPADPIFEPHSLVSQNEAPAPPDDPILMSRPTAIATATSEKLPTAWSGMRKVNKIVSPLELDEAIETAARESAAESKRSPGTPLAIGLALAAIAVGAVAIRRRFS